VADVSGMSLSFGDWPASGSSLIGVLGSGCFPSELSELANPLPNRLEPASLGLGRSSFALPSDLNVVPSLNPLKLPRPDDFELFSVAFGASCACDGWPNEVLPNEEPWPKAPPDAKLPVVEFSVTVDPKEELAGIPGFCCPAEENGDDWVLLLSPKDANADDPEAAAEKGEAPASFSPFCGLVKLEKAEAWGLLSPLLGLAKPNADDCVMPWLLPSLPTLPNAEPAGLLVSVLGFPNEPEAGSAGLLCSVVGFPKLPKGDDVDALSPPLELAKPPNGEGAEALLSPPGFAKFAKGD
jgi:hypothetical protein